MPETKRHCKVMECEEYVKARGRCQRHYDAMRYSLEEHCFIKLPPLPLLDNNCRLCGCELIQGTNWCKSRVGKKDRICTPCSSKKHIWKIPPDERLKRKKTLRDRNTIAVKKCRLKPNIRSKYYTRTYGITEEEYQGKLAAQQGVCFICGFPPKLVRLAIDHRHIKGYDKLSEEEKRKEVRGLLCHTCNKGIGLLLECKSIARKNLQKVNEYFSVYKMKGD